MKRTHEAAGRPMDSAGEERPPALRRISGARASDRAQPTLADLGWTLVERWRTVALVAAVALLASVGYVLVAPPTYQASVLLQVDGSARPAGPEDFTRLFETAPRIEGEMRLLWSRALLANALESLGLDVDAHPRTLPVVGAAVARRHQGELAARAPLGLGRFGWGGERIAIGRLAVPDALVDEPLALVALGDGRYELTTPGGRTRVTGAVGQTVSVGEGNEAVSLLVSELKARPGTEFVVRKLRVDDVIEELQKSLTVMQQGKDSALVEVTLKGTDPRRITSILEALATRYVRQSFDKATAEAATVLRVLDAKLPPLKAKADAAESALDRFHRKNGTLNLSIEGARLLARIGEIDHEIDVAEAARLDDARQHTTRYPEATDPSERISRLKSERAALDAQMYALPGLELEYARLVREAGVATERYTSTFNRAEELRTVTSGWVGNTRIVEHAIEPRRPVSPKKGLALALSTLVGLVGGIGAVLLRNAFDEGIRDPEELEALTGVPVFATIAHSEPQRRMARRAGRRGRLEALSAVSPGDAAVEDLRALRTGLEFALQRASNNVVAVGSPAPCAGKSFVSVNLAHLLSAVDGRVLLVDGDLRLGTLHRYFGLDAQPGVADVLLGEATVEQAVHRTENANVDLLPTGKSVTNPAELLAGASFQQLIDGIRDRYKVVIVDTTPTLSVTDSAGIARHAGVNLLVVRAREQNASEVSLAVKRLVRNGARVRGTILNDVRPTLGRFGRSGGYRRYDTRDA